MRRNIRNSLIKVTDAGWKILGSPKESEDMLIEKFWESADGISGDDVKLESEPGESKSDIENGDYSPFDSFLAEEQADLDWEVPVGPEVNLRRLPTGKTERRIVKENFQQIQDSVERLRETYYNLQGALRISSKQDGFVSDWIKKSPILFTIKEKLLELESLTAVAVGRTGSSIPVISNVEAVRAMNKAGNDAQRERRPLDIRVQRQKRKRDHDRALKALDTLQTPLVEAHRPNKKRISEASRYQKNYERIAKKKRVPKQLHSAIKSTLHEDGSL